jgi:hypothetical protein
MKDYAGAKKDLLEALKEASATEKRKLLTLLKQAQEGLIREYEYSMKQKTLFKKAFRGPEDDLHRSISSKNRIIDVAEIRPKSSYSNILYFLKKQSNDVLLYFSCALYRLANIVNCIVIAAIRIVFGSKNDFN